MKHWNLNKLIWNPFEIVIDLKTREHFHQFQFVFNSQKHSNWCPVGVFCKISNLNFPFFEQICFVLSSDAVMSAYCIQLTELLHETDLFLFRRSPCQQRYYSVMFKCVLEQNQNLSYCVRVNLIEVNFPIGFDFIADFLSLNYSMYVFLRSFTQDAWMRGKNHGSNLMSKFIFTRPVGNIITACIHRFSGTQIFRHCFSSIETNELRCKFSSKRFML